MAAHDHAKLYAVPLGKKHISSAQVAAAAGLPQLIISRCMSPTPVAPVAKQEAVEPIVVGKSPPQINPMGSLSSNDTLSSLDAHHTCPLVAHIDRSKVLGSGQYSTVCRGSLGHSLPSASTSHDDRLSNIITPCAVKIPHAGNLDARELGLIEAAAFWQLGPTPAATVGCFGMVNLRDLNGQSQGACVVYPWPAAAAQAIAGDGEWALVLELCDNGPGWSWMVANRQLMNAELFFQWARQLTMAVLSLKDAGMAHMDIKGHNILLDRNGDICLADFTAAKFSAAALATMRDTCPGFAPLDYPPYTDFSGTVPYCAPESLASPMRSENSADELHKMDVYSLGVTLYTLFVSGREPYASVKSSVEQMLLASKGAFWEWEERHYLTSMPTAIVPSTANASGALDHSVPGSSLHAPANRHLGRSTLPSSPVSAAAAVGPPWQTLSRSLSSGPDSPAPLVRRRTLRSHKATPREFRRFLSGDPLPANIEALLCSMVNPDPSKRPDASEILRVLDTIEPDIFEP
ncbi:hypothetical protein GGI11_003566 [Coemansia sp. RSA 2049]|nr:hypothetical protein GGI11_003566 [Coemansia sp. RSA 2049]